MADSKTSSSKTKAVAKEAKTKAKKAKPVGKQPKVAAKQPKQDKKPQTAKRVAPKATEGAAKADPSKTRLTKAQMSKDPKGGPESSVSPANKGAGSAIPGPKASHRTAKIVTIVAAIVLYALGATYFSSHFLPGTKIDGMDASFQDVGSVVAAAEQRAQGYALQVEGDGLSLTVKGADLGLVCDAEALREGVSQRLPSALWLPRLFLPRDYSMTEGISYNERALSELVEGVVASATADDALPRNATLSYDSETATFKVVPEQEGTAIDEASAQQAVAQAVGTLQERVILDEQVHASPTVLASDPRMKEASAQAARLVGSSLELTVGGSKAYVVETDQLCSWVTVDDSYQPCGDLEAITDWARGELSQQVDTVATVRTYTRTNDGKRIEVYGGGTYGWNMDGAALAQVICDRMASRSFEPIEIPMQSEGAVYVHGGQDWGPRYLDVDLTEQYVRMFDDDSNVIMESACVSGDISNNDETVTGVYMIEDKESPKTLIGLDNDGDGEPDYESDVEFWMPFFGGYGLHDALWRDYFGDDVYQYSGSHGCINLPYYSAELLYSLVRIGDVVVVHY